MSFLPDLSSWALSGLRNDRDEGRSNEEDHNQSMDTTPKESEEEIRAKRLARLSRAETTQSQDSNPAEIHSSMEVTSSPDLDFKMEVKQAVPTAKSHVEPMEVEDYDRVAKKMREKEPLAKVVDPNRKLQRKKELLLRKMLNLKITGGDISESDCVFIDIATDVLTVDNVQEILASRLSMSPKLLEHVPSRDRNLISYLASSYKKVSEELKSITSKSENDEDLKGILEEIRKQVVSFAASSLIVPDLFELAEDAVDQLVECLSNSVLDPLSSITIGVSGPGSSFYASLCDELTSNDSAAFENIIISAVEKIKVNLVKYETILESSGASGLVQVGALTALCSVKKAAIVVAKSPGFLLPVVGSKEAGESVSMASHVPPPPPGATPQQVAVYRMMSAMAQGRLSYLRRSGPALEKDTLLGLILRLGIPFDKEDVSSQFQNMTKRSRADLNKTTTGMRRQLKSYQDSFHALIKVMITAGEEARNRVLNWFTDALLVNTGATAFRPDKTKVSNPQTLQNIATALLKLCEPFMNDHSRIHPGFVSSETDHLGIFSISGDNAVPRLGDNAVMVMEPYAPKNKFIPQCFFLCARALHLSIVAGAEFHTGISRQASHTAWSIRQRGGDISSDPNLNHILSIQYANEVSLLSPDFVIDSLRFFNLSARFLLDLDDQLLPLMPEHLVEDYCEYIVFITKFAPEHMKGIDMGGIFRATVKLLNPKYANVSLRNVLSFHALISTI